MYIRCKSCGQLLYIPDDANNQAVKCPACQTEFLYTPENKPTNKDFFDSENKSTSFDQQYHRTLQFEELSETASIESYHQSRNLTIQPFFSWDALMTAYRFIAERFVMMILMAILLIAPNFIMHLVQNTLIPNITELQNSLSEKETLEEVVDAYMTISKDIPVNKAMALIVVKVFISLLNVFLVIGGIRLFNAYGRNQKASFSLLFSGFDSPLRILIATVLLFVLLMAFSVAGTLVLIIAAKAGLSLFGILLFFVMLIFFFVYLFFVFPLIADSNISATKAFQLSYIIARQNISTLFGVVSLLFLISMLINYFAIIAFGGFLSNIYVSLISQALFEPILIGVVSVSYLKATGQFRQF